MSVSESQLRLVAKRVEEAGRRKTTALKRRSDATAKALKLRTEAQRTKSESTRKSKLSQADREDQAIMRADQDLLRAERDQARHSIDLEKLRSKRQQETEKAQAAAMNNLVRRNEQLERRFAVMPMAEDQYLTQDLTTEKKYDFFLSHASEDKDEIARPLKEALESLGATVWFDEMQIKVGQSIRREIEKGLGASDFGIVIVSENFLKKNWTQMELDSLYEIKMSTGKDLILPVWHKVSKDQVTRASISLAGIHALNSSLLTVNEMALELNSLRVNPKTPADR